MLKGNLDDIPPDVVKGVNLKTSERRTLGMTVSNVNASKKKIWISSIKVSMYANHAGGVIKDVSDKLETRTMKHTCVKIKDGVWRVELRSVKIPKIAPSTRQQKCENFHIVVDLSTTNGEHCSMISNSFKIHSHQTLLRKAAQKTSGKRKRKPAANITTKRKAQQDQREQEVAERELKMAERELKIAERERQLDVREQVLLKNESYELFGQSY